MRIVCVGGGPSGLYFAILAARDGHEVTVLERATEDTIHGWGIVLSGDILEKMRAADPESGEPVTAAAYPWRDQIVMVDGKPHIPLGMGGWAMGRRVMRDALLARARELGVDVRFEHPVTDLSELPEHDLLVAADGVNSGVRQAHAAAFGTDVVRGRNKYTWLGTDRVFDAFRHGFVRTPAGWIWAGAYAYDPEMSTFTVEMTAETWRGLGFEGLSTDETMRRLEGYFAGLLDGHALRPQAGAGDTTQWLEFQRVTNERWRHGDVVLVGDAAHTTHFTIGSGTVLALEDSIALAEELRRHDELSAGLDAYEQRRIAEMRHSQSMALYSGRFFEQLDRYVEHDRFPDLLMQRSSRLLPLLPVRAYLLLLDLLRRGPR